MPWSTFVVPPVCALARANAGCSAARPMCLQQNTRTNPPGCGALHRPEDLRRCGKWDSHASAAFSPAFRLPVVVH
eukprot:1157411-Pelagomonas_calceolata.AAC.3